MKTFTTIPARCSPSHPPSNARCTRPLARGSRIPATKATTRFSRQVDAERTRERERERSIRIKRDVRFPSPRQNAAQEEASARLSPPPPRHVRICILQREHARARARPSFKRASWSLVYEPCWTNRTVTEQEAVRVRVEPLLIYARCILENNCVGQAIKATTPA